MILSEIREWLVPLAGYASPLRDKTCNLLGKTSPKFRGF